MTGSSAYQRSRKIAAGQACQSWMWTRSTGRSPRASPERLERGPAEQPEPPGVVGEVAAAGRAVEAVAIERGRVVDEPEAVAVRRDVDDRDVDRAGERVRIGDADGRRRGRSRPEPARSGSAGGRRRRGHRSRPGPAAKRPGERVDHVAQAAGLRPRLAFGGDERDAERFGHRRHVAIGAGASRRSRRSAGRALNRFRRRRPAAIIPRHGSGSQHPRDSRPPRSASRRSSRDSAASPTTSTGLASAGAR